MSIDLYVLLPTHERPALLRRTLDSLAACEKPSAYQETIVVENGSRAGAEAIVAECPPDLHARYLHVEHANKSHALNQALEIISDGLIFFTDDDVRLHPKILCAYAEAAARTEHKKAIFGGPVEVEREADPPSWMIDFFPHSVRGYDLVGTSKGTTYLGFNWAAFAKDIKQFGGFDPRLGPGSPADATGQEYDMQLRLLEHGYEDVDVMGAVVKHYVPSENMNFNWLVHRKYRGGVRNGLVSDDEFIHFFYQIFTRLLKLAGVLVKYSLLFDRTVIVNCIFGFALNIGSIKGYMHSYNDNLKGKDA